MRPEGQPPPAADDDDEYNEYEDGDVPMAEDNEDDKKNKNIPSGQFIDEILKATSLIRETSYIHQDVIDDMYLQEYH